MPSVLLIASLRRRRSSGETSRITQLPEKSVPAGTVPSLGSRTSAAEQAPSNRHSPKQECSQLFIAWKHTQYRLYEAMRGDEQLFASASCGVAR
jgi:hypothetical protein